MLAGGVALGVVAVKWLLPRKVAEPQFKTVRSFDGIEVREYGATVVAETVVEGAFDKSLSEGFRRLARYIFGGNRRHDRIAMTAPVSQQPDTARGDKIAMTAPVGAQAEGARWRVTFTMPEGATLETLPEPIDERVKLRAVPARRVAALRFSGWAGEVVSADKKREALERIATHQLKSAGEPILAQYDPPWTLPFLRRNEILVELTD